MTHHLTDKPILVVEDEESIMKLVGRLLDSRGYRHEGVPTADEAKKLLDSRQIQGYYALVISDIVLKGSNHDGADLTKHISESYPQLPVLIMSGHTSRNYDIQGLSKGNPLVDFLPKPFSYKDFFHKLDTLLKTASFISEGESRGGGKEQRDSLEGRCSFVAI